MRSPSYPGTSPGYTVVFVPVCREITAELERLTQTLQKLHNKVAGKHDEVHGWLRWKFRAPVFRYTNV